MNAIPPLVDPELVRLYMRQWTTGVTVVTSALGGVRHGMTVSAFTSISLEPPRVLVSIARLARTHQLIEDSRIFGVTILNSQQAEVSEVFAGRIGEDQDRFAGLETFTLATGAPFLRDGLAFFDCHVHLAFEVGDVTLFIGDVIALQGVPEDSHPLVYYNRSYHRLG